LKRRPTAREQEAAAAARPPRRIRVAPPAGELEAMLLRRGFRPTRAPLDVPFDPDLVGEPADSLAEQLSHYAFRLFLRGAIQRGAGFAPGEATRYLRPAQARTFAEALVGLGLAQRAGRSRYCLLRRARSFGGTLEWYVARELRRRYGFETAAGLKFRAPGVGGDLDVVAAAEGKLVYLELKSSPPRHLSEAEVAAFLDRALALRADLTLFVMDTALRLSDKVVPLLAAEIARRRTAPPVQPRAVERELWALTPSLYAVNAKPDLLGNIARAVAEGLRARTPVV
jgi:hypothetical protein